MAKKVKLEVELEHAQLEETTEGFVRLERQIKETRIEMQKAQEVGDSVKFNQLKGQLADLEDGLEKVRFQSKEFHDALATIPGPAGKVGTAMQGVDASFKMLMANPIIATIAAIAGVLMLMYKALNSTSEGQATLKKMTDAANRALAPLLAIVERVAVPLFEGFAEVLTVVATGFEKFANWLGISKTKVDEINGSTKEFFDQAQRDLDNMAKVQQILEQQRKEKEQKAKEAAQKEKDRKDKEKADREKELQDQRDFTYKLEEISESAIANEDERKIQQRMNKLRKDTVELEEDLHFIKMDEETKNVYRYQLQEAAQNDLNKMLEEKKKAWTEKEIQMNKQVTQSYIDMASNLATTFNNTAQLMEKGSTAAKAFGILSVVANAAAGIGAAIIKNQEAQAAYNKTIAEGTAGLASAGILMSNPLTAALGVAQAAASKVAIGVATAGKATSKINMGIQIGAIAAASAAQIAAISSGTKSSSSSSGGGGGGSNPSISNIGAAGLPAPTIGGTATNPNQQLADMMGNRVANSINTNPVKAYVVNQDIKTADQFDRRVLAASKLG